MESDEGGGGGIRRLDEIPPRAEDNPEPGQVTCSLVINLFPSGTLVTEPLRGKREKVPACSRWSSQMHYLVHSLK